MSEDEPEPSGSDYTFYSKQNNEENREENEDKDQDPLVGQKFRGVRSSFGQKFRGVRSSFGPKHPLFR